MSEKAHEKCAFSCIYAKKAVPLRRKLRECARMRAEV